MKGHFDSKKNYFVPDVEELKNASWTHSIVAGIATIAFIGIIYLALYIL